MSRRRHRTKRTPGSVELNLAAMLDMAFQLLTFFILTFRPAPIEGQLAVSLPPPVDQAPPQIEAPRPAAQPGHAAAPLETMNLHVSADSAGEIREIRIGKRAVAQGRFDDVQQRRLANELNALFAVNGAPFDRVQIVAEGRLAYGDLMKVIDVCSHQKLPDDTYLQKISFIESDVAR